MLSSEQNILIILGCAFVGLLWAIVNASLVSKIRFGKSQAAYKGVKYNKY